MNENPAKPTYIFRMVHFDNLEYILIHGMQSRSNSTNENYVEIGNQTLIKQRNDYSVGIDPPGGNLGDFVPFYFAGHTPMLLNIKTGYSSVPKRPQTDIVFICCDVEIVVSQCPEWCFTDGHAKNRITSFYNDLEDLSQIDWTAVKAQYWKDDEEDMDRHRKKQSEFLVKNHVPVNCIKSIFVRDENRKAEVEKLIEHLELTIPVAVDKSNKLYYND